MAKRAAAAKAAPDADALAVEAEAQAAAEARRRELAAACALDPLGWARAAFPWGQGELKGHAGPRAWQAEALDEIGRRLRAGHEPGAALEPALSAVASGHGVGKSAFVGMLVNWAMATREGAKCVITANTENQLRTKTWPEIVKWFRLSAAAPWFRVTQNAIRPADPSRDPAWRADAIPWSETNAEAFAGLHNVGKRILLVFDEASAIPDGIWEVAEGALTDEGTEIVWTAFGNPTRNVGRFRECFGRFRHRWATRTIDSRDVEGTNKAQLAKWIEDYGEDSDFVRVRVRGLFPQASSTQFIPSDAVDAAMRREATASLTDPLVLGVDVARFGDDQSVIRFRRGRDARSIAPIKMRGKDTMELAGHVAALIQRHRPEAVFVDETGVGAGVVDRLRQLGHPAIGVNFGARPDGAVEGEKVANKRAEMWARLRHWLKTGGAIDPDPALRADLEGVEYGYDADNAVRLEKKDEMKKRGLASPDDGDALALTFAYPVAPRAAAPASSASRRTALDHDPFADA